MLTNSCNDNKKMAIKLHKQFAHPASERLIKLLRDAKKSSVKLEQEIKSISENCDICCKLKKPKPRPVVSLPLSSKFNGTVAMDLKYWDKGIHFLVMVDVATRFCSAAVIKDKRPSTILRMIFIHWVSKFGAPKQILSDNGMEFNNEEMRQFGESFNTKIMNTAAESPWSNGCCEKLNGLLGQMVTKIVSGASCEVSVALAWAVSARNALSNFSGFSPNQLVFGSNPAVPEVYNSDPPALEKVTSSDIVRQNLNALHMARRDFIQVESDERIRRAMRCNIRSTPMENLQNGDEVYFKRNDSTQWKGPGIIIGRDGKQVLVRHGGTYVRVHTCRLAKVPIESLDLGGNECKDTNPINRPEVVRPSSDRTTEHYEHQCQNNEVVALDDTASPDVENDSNSDMSDYQDTQETGIDEENNEEFTDTPEQRISGKTEFKSGDRVKGIDSNSGDFITGKIVSRAGKASGKFRNCFNVKLDSDGSIQWFDLDKFDSVNKVPDKVEVVVFYNNEEVSLAKEQEIKNWRDNNVYEEVHNEGQECLSVRWVVTEKVKNGNTLTKARLVVRGFEEDSLNIQKDSPTCSREALRLSLAVASSKCWNVHSLDIKSAYLQGEPIDREIYLYPPPEFNDGRLWKLKKTVYGLCDAARAWYKTVVKELIELGLSMCKLDPSLFYMVQQNELIGIICVHVDDFFWCGTDHFQKTIMIRLSDKFAVGSSEMSNFKYLGLNVRSSSNAIIVDQNEYAAALKSIPISQLRAGNKCMELTGKEKEEYRALIGQLSWLSTQTRPDIAFETCELHVSLKSATINDLTRLNKLVNRVKSSPLDIGFPKLGSLEACHIEAYCDASYANVQNGKSQGGFIIFVMNQQGMRCPVYWQSRAIRRVVKSTLAAETLALVECAETAAYISLILQELTAIKLKIVCKVDNKSLVDAIYSSKNVEDRRLRVDIAVIKDMVERHELQEVIWVSTKLQLADSLTKRGACSKQLCAALRHD